jgi:aminopeptidase-like protein
MHDLAARLFPICRSITGAGVRESLAILSETLPLEVREVPTGTPAFDWEVPQEWRIRDAYVADESGERIVDFAESNLHVVGYSTPVDAEMGLAELDEHLHSLPELPEAIPYVTSYYAPRWGFCLPHAQRERLTDQRYRVHIDSELFDGSLSYGECVVPGEVQDEVLLSTYVCHPSMANNELSGPVVCAFLGAWLTSMPRHLTYRLVFVPETIGSLVYLSRNLEHLQRSVIAGFNVSCVGDEGPFSAIATRYGGTLADRVTAAAYAGEEPLQRFSFLDRGSDERQYNAPGVDLPVVGVCRSRFGDFPEYHTSLDDLTLVTARGLQDSLDGLRRCVEALEANRTYRAVHPGEPQLGKRGMYPTLSTRESHDLVGATMDLLAYADGTNDLLAIAERIDVPFAAIVPVAQRLAQARVIEEVSAPAPTSR